MKTIFYSSASLLIFLSSAFILKTGNDWKIVNDKYSVKFSAGETEGMIKGLTGTIKFDENDLAGSSFNVLVDVNTINTGNGMKNKHAKGKNWLDAAKHPTMNFVSSAFTKTANGYDVKGKLTLKGIAKEITIPFTFDNKEKSGTFKGGFKIQRKDYGIDEDGIDETVKIDLIVPVKL